MSDQAFDRVRRLCMRRIIPEMDINEGEACAVFVVVGGAAAAAEPYEGACDGPALRPGVESTAWLERLTISMPGTEAGKSAQ